jgi:hypothetical protein
MQTDRAVLLKNCVLYGFRITRTWQIIRRAYYSITAPVENVSVADGGSNPTIDIFKIMRKFDVRQTLSRHKASDSRILDL